jgi:hypothetical protein
LTPDTHALALGMAIYPAAYAGGAALIHKARRTRTAVPTVHDAKRAAQRAARKELKRQLRKSRR